MKENLKKHSVMIAGHATSITLEPLFWDELNRIAVKENKSVNQIVSEIDNKKAPDINLSSALRVFVLSYVKSE